MSPANVVFLVFIVAAFAAYGLLLFTAWVVVLLFEKKKLEKAADGAAPVVKAERPMTTA